MKNKYYQKHKERLWKETPERYQNCSEEEKDKRWKKFQERDQNLSEEQKQKLFERMINYYSAHKRQLSISLIRIFFRAN